MSDEYKFTKYGKTKNKELSQVFRGFTKTFNKFLCNNLKHDKYTIDFFAQ